jgi:hypothetical protein
VKSRAGIALILHISASHSVVSGALVVEKEVTQSRALTKQQYLVYFILEVLVVSKMYCFEVEKICYAVIMCSRKLRYSFVAHHIIVLANQPLHDIFHNRDSSGQIRKWATELLEYVINFERRVVMKSQILVDFVPEWMEPQSQADTVQEFPWLVYCDGACGSTRARAATILTSPSGIKLRYTARLQFTSNANKCTNSIAMYEAILLGL